MLLPQLATALDRRRDVALSRWAQLPTALDAAGFRARLIISPSVQRVWQRVWRACHFRLGRILVSNADEAMQSAVLAVADQVLNPDFPGTGLRKFWMDILTEQEGDEENAEL